MANAFRKKGLKFFSVAMFLVVFGFVFLNFATITFAKTGQTTGVEVLGTNPGGGQLLYDWDNNKFTITGEHDNPTITSTEIVNSTTYYLGSNNKAYFIDNNGNLV